MKNVSKKLIAGFFLCVVLGVSGWYFFHAIFDEIDSLTPSTGSRIVQAENGQTIEAEFSDAMTLRRVLLWCPEDSSSARGYITTQLYSADGTEVFHQWTYYSDMKENSYNAILSNFQYDVTEDSPVRVTITFTLESGAPFSYRANWDNAADMEFTGFRNSSDNSTLLTGYWMIFSFVSAAVLLAYLMLFVFRAPLHWTFAACGLLLILAFELALPITTVPDEYYHYRQAYRISDELMGNPCGDNLITARADDQDCLNSRIYWVGNSPDKHTYVKVWSAIGKKATSTQLVSIQLVRLSWDGPAYCAGGLGITLGRLLGLNGITTACLARLAAALAYLLLCTLAIYAAPVRKGFFALASVLPMALHLGSSVSYDLGMFPAAYLIVALWLRIMAKPEENKIGWKDWLPFAASLMLIAPSKVYLFVCLFALFVPKSKFHDLRSAYFYRFGTLFACGLFMFLLTGGNAVGYLERADSVRYSISYFQDHLKNLIPLLFSTLQNTKEVSFGELIGSRLAWHNVLVDQVWIYLFYMLLAVACIWQKDEDDLIPKPFGKIKWGFAAVALLVIAGVIYASMTWTLISREWFEGIQGRYFLPLLPVFLLLARQNNILAKRPTDRKLFFCGVCAEFFVVLEILTKTVA